MEPNEKITKTLKNDYEYVIIEKYRNFDCDNCHKDNTYEYKVLVNSENSIYDSEDYPYEHFMVCWDCGCNQHEWRGDMLAYWTSYDDKLPVYLCDCGRGLASHSVGPGECVTIGDCFICDAKDVTLERS